MIRIHFTYRHVDKPWGGANNFVRALRGALQESGEFTLVDDPEAASDIVFMNQLGTGPGGQGRTMTIEAVRRLRAAGRQIVVRAVNLNWHAFRLGPKNLTIGWWNDRKTVQLLNMADLVIFQSAYQQGVFVRAGYRGTRSVVIHNGAPRDFWIPEPAVLPIDGPLRIVSSTASARASKRHDLISRMSECDGVEVTHLGAWPESVPRQRVRCLGMLERSAMVQELSLNHAFLHTAVKDPCPNAVFEALCAGLPVIYNPGPGSSAEIVRGCGLPLVVDDPSATVEHLRNSLPALRTHLLAERGRCSIGYAAARYREEFERLLTMPRMAA
jgi:glycosyltransferase involved in cell wall biosynthesis